MKEMDMNAVLSQIRAHTNMIRSEQTAQLQEHVQQPGFSELLKSSIDQVNQLQKQSGDLGKAFELGESNVSLAEVMIAKQKAGIAFQSVLQVRNKLLEAYRQVMSMHV